MMSVALFCSVVCALLLPVHLSDARCATDFQYIDVTGSCYKILYVRSTDAEARALCEEHGAHLLAVESEAEDDAIVDVIKSWAPYEQKAACRWPGWGGLSYLTAGQRRLEDDCSSEFVWKTRSADGAEITTNLTYTNWYRDEPNCNPDEVVEGCMHYIEAYNYQWNDYRCSSYGCPICEAVSTARNEESGNVDEDNGLNSLVENDSKEANEREGNKRRMNVAQTDAEVQKSE